MIEPVQKITGAEFKTRMTGCACYGWWREGRYLYIGATAHGFRRLFANHKVFKEFEDLRPTDEIHVWPVVDSGKLYELERSLICELRPVLNEMQPSTTLGRVGWMECKECGTPFKQKRGWQRYCSDVCEEANKARIHSGERKMLKCASKVCGGQMFEQDENPPTDFTRQLCHDCRKLVVR